MAGPLLRDLAAGTRRDVVVERVVFALVANRALAPSSQLAASSWIAHDVHLPGLTGVSGSRTRPCWLASGFRPPPRTR